VVDLLDTLNESKPDYQIYLWCICPWLAEPGSLNYCLWYIINNDDVTAIIENGRLLIVTLNCTTSECPNVFDSLVPACERMSMHIGLRTNV